MGFAGALLGLAGAALGLAGALLRFGAALGFASAGAFDGLPLGLLTTSAAGSDSGFFDGLPLGLLGASSDFFGDFALGRSVTSTGSVIFGRALCGAPRSSSIGTFRLLAVATALASFLFFCAASLVSFMLRFCASFASSSIATGAAGLDGVLPALARGVTDLALGFAGSDVNGYW